MQKRERRLLAPLGRHCVPGGEVLVSPAAARRAIDAARSDLPVLWSAGNPVLRRLAGLVRWRSLTLTDAGVVGEVEWVECAALRVAADGALVTPLWIVREGVFEGLYGFRLEVEVVANAIPPLADQRWGVTTLNRWGVRK